jgi:hypothetical protein
LKGLAQQASVVVFQPATWCAFFPAKTSSFPCNGGRAVRAVIWHSLFKKSERTERAYLNFNPQLSPPVKGLLSKNLPLSILLITRMSFQYLQPENITDPAITRLEDLRYHFAKGISANIYAQG